MNRMVKRPSVNGQAAVPGRNEELRIRPEQVWEQLSQSQRQAVYQALVEVGRRLQRPAKTEGRDEDA